MKNKLAMMLDQRARTYEAEAELATNQFNKGFFEGKAEQARQTIAAIDYVIKGDVESAVDALNGNL